MAAAAATCTLGLVCAGSVSPAAATVRLARRTPVLVTSAVNLHERGIPIPQSFLGISTDWDEAVHRTGIPSTGPNDVYDRLIANLARYGGGIPTLRVGGNFQDSAWWDPTGQVTLRDDERGLYTPITALTLDGLALNVRRTGQRMILGLDLGADDPALAQTELREFLKYLPRRSIIGLSIGNEPGQYPYHIRFEGTRNGRHVVTYLRARSWNGPQYIGQWLRFARSLRRVLPGVPLAGTDNFPGLVSAQAFVSRTRRMLAVYTQHYYALAACTQGGHQYRPGNPNYPTLAGLLGHQPFSLSPDVTGGKVARRYRKPFYIDEMNSTSCGGRHGLSDSLGAGLWLLDQYLTNVFIRVRGVDLHSDNPVETPFGFGYDVATHKWTGYVTPLYYAMLAFAQAVGKSGRLLAYPLFAARSPEHANVHVWGIREPNHSLRLVVINKDLRRGGLVRLFVPHAHRSAMLTRLVGPSPTSSTGVSLAGQSVASDGALVGRVRARAVKPVRGFFDFTMPSASAAILTIP
jgi:hypothetical protein